MSTVAFDGRYFAADTQVTSYTVSHGFSKMKVLKNRKGQAQYVFMITGSAYAFEHLIKAFLGIGTELPPDAFGNDNSEMYIADLINKKAYLSSPGVAGVHFLEWLPHDPYVGGSGGALARGAMACGKSSLDAIRIASKFDPYTNDDVQYFDLLNPRDFSHLTAESIISFNDFTACDKRFIHSSDFRVNYLKRSKAHKDKEEQKIAPPQPTGHMPFPGLQVIQLPNKQKNKRWGSKPKNSRNTVKKKCQ